MSASESPNRANPANQTTFRTWLAGRTADDALLTEYVHSVGAEWWCSEWKSSEDAVGFGVRKTAAAMANGRGGELFVGVRNDRSVVGTTSTLQQLEQELRQPLARPGTWYIVSLLQPTRYVTEVELTSPRLGRRVFVLEVSPSGIPAFVREDDVSLSLFLRSGGSSVRASSFEALEWSREVARERLLLGIFREFETMVRQVRIAHGYQMRVSAGIQPRLPLLVRSLQNGSFYELLSDDDIRALLGRRTTTGTGDSGGYLSGFLDLEEQVSRARYLVAKDVEAPAVEGATIQQLSHVHQMLEQDVSSFRIWLVNQHLLTE